MKALVEFKPNRFNPINNLWLMAQTAMLIARAKLFRRNIRIKITPVSMKYIQPDPSEQADWYKILGTKSGVVTDTNDERILAWRWKTGAGHSEFCEYIRNKGAFPPGGNKASEEVKRKVLEGSYEIKPSFALPVSMYNGGTYPAPERIVYWIEANLGSKY